MKNIIGKDYIRFLNEIKSRIISARIKAARSVNKDLIKLYWDIGSVKNGVRVNLDGRIVRGTERMFKKLT